MKRGIVAVGLNPAIDETLFVSDFRTAAVNRVSAVEIHAGGKAVNVARFLTGLDSQVKVALTGFLGQDNDRIFLDAMNNAGIADHCIRIPGSTRRCIKIVDSPQESCIDNKADSCKASLSMTELNYPGLTPGEAELDQLLDLLEELAAGYCVFVLTGSLPPDVPDDFYARIITLLKSRDCMLLLDSSGEALREGLRAGPNAVKPNLEEFSGLVSEEINTIEDILRFSSSFVDTSCLLAVSMGADGALFSWNGQHIHTLPPIVTCLSTVGAGDAMTAGIAAGLLAGSGLSEIAVQACASGSYAVGQVEPGLHDSARLQGIRQGVQALTISNQ
ncbi:1-phosphofructokinase family hexose kinase [Spirochaeta dissipatitropha]